MSSPDHLAYFGLLSAILSCAHTQPHAGPYGVPELDFAEARYDGRLLAGRLLVHARSASALLDPRLIENSTVSIQEATACGNDELTPPRVIRDYFPRPLRPEEVLELPRNFWYGRDIELAVFDHLGPKCLNLTIAVTPVDALGQHVGDGSARARIELQVRRTP
jgi:hypothetical protein